FTTNDGDLCAGAEITFSGNNSSFQLGAITDYNWSFGTGATPASATGVGPHNVIYESPGEKNVLLTVETDLGCVASDRNEAIVVIEACCDERNAITASGEVTDAICEGQNGAIDVQATSPSAIVGYNWSNNAQTEDVDSLAPDNYVVTITNVATCEAVVPFEVAAAAPFEVVADLTLPSCNGGQNGVISLTTNGGASPILVDFGAGYTELTQLNNLPQGTYAVKVQDANGCEEELSVDLQELALTIDSAQMTIQPPSCNGFSNGRIAIQVTNGEPNYSYDWNDANGPVVNSSLNNIPAGNYRVDVIDANNCAGTFEFVMEEPTALVLALDTTNISCQGQTDGAITAMVEGGTGSYIYEWSNGETSEQIINLIQGDYTLNITDENDCLISGAATIIEPSSIDLQVTGTTDALCFGEETGSISVLGSGGNNIFQYSADGVSFQDDPTLSGLGAGEYTLTVRDPRGCTATTTASIGEPEPLSVDAGEDQYIDLGYSTDFQTIQTPFTRPVVYNWSSPDFLSCTDCPDPTATPSNTMPFVVTVTDETSCTAFDTVMVFVNLIRPIYVPNVFTPNFDGRNDKFTIFGGPAAVRIKTLHIFDRWGNLVFNEQNLPISDNRFGWDGFFDGRTLPPGVYTYMADVVFFDGVEEVFSGDVTLVK
ncbi:MAG: gliding motility-associated C-terminal domain-containing protein, partial [Bacteroidota bacterium]